MSQEWPRFGAKFDRQIPAEEVRGDNGEEGGGVGWRGGGGLTDRWERCEVGGTGVSELDKPLSAHIMCIRFLFLVRFLAFFLFPPAFSSHTVQARDSVFHVYPSGLHKCP